MTRSLTRALLTGAIAATALTAVVAPANAHRAVRSDAVIAWNANAGKAALAACISPSDDPLHESRLYAMTHVAIHDALNAIDRRSRPYAFNARAKRGASLDAAVAAAARDVLVTLLGQLPAPFPQACIDAGVASVEADYATALAAIPDGRPKTRGIDAGTGRRRGHPRPARRGRLRHAAARPGYPQGTAPGRVPLHARTARSRSRRAGERSRRSCSGTARSSVPVRPTR